jgi:pectinesterase
MPSRDPEGVRRLAVVVSVLFVVVAGGIVPAVAQEDTAGTPTAAGTATGIVVDDSGGGDYKTISAAVAAASPGETVTVRSGVYPEEILLNKSITLVAPEGAVLDGRGMQPPDSGITIEDDAAPTIRGFTIVGYQVGVRAKGTSGDWVLDEVAVRNSSAIGVYTAQSSGNWTIQGSNVHNSSMVGVGAFRSRGDWRIVRTTIADTTGVAINARYASGSWTVDDTVIRNTSTGGGTIPWDGTAVYAGNTSGPWTITGSTFQNNEQPVVDASGAAPAGNATGNFWTSDPQSGGACVGNVNCGSPLSVPPVDAGGAGIGEIPEGSNGNGDGLPLVQIAIGVVGLLVLLGIGFVVVNVVGVSSPVGAVEALLAQVLALAGVIDSPKSGGGGGNRTIALANVGNETVTCRVQCQTNAGTQFQYDLTLKSGEQREATELPATGPYKVSVQVGDVGAEQTFQDATDVIVRVVSNDAEVVAA